MDTFLEMSVIFKKKFMCFKKKVCKCIFDIVGKKLGLLNYGFYYVGIICVYMLEKLSLYIGKFYDATGKKK